MKYEIFSCIFFGVICHGGGQDRRDGKWLFYPRTITTYVHEKSLITESVPSSCVAVQSSLPPCRHVRQLDIRPHPTEKIEITASPELLGVHTGFAYGPRFIFGSEVTSKNERQDDEDLRPLSWAEYLGLEDVTVTKTAVHSVTAKYYDPNTVVTFNVRGCRPSKLPFNLPLCNTTSRTANSLSKEVHYAP